MLGHIAIAAMGGCFSQNPDTGAAEATYFPTEKVIIVGNFNKMRILGAGEATFASWFTAAKWWARMKVDVSPDYAGYTTIFSIRKELPSSQAVGCRFVGHNNHMLIYVNKDVYYLGGSGKFFTEFVTYKNENSNAFVVSNAYETLQRSVYGSTVLDSESLPFSIGPTSTTITTQFWGDLLRNDTHSVYWRRLPMVCVEKVGTALFEVDGKELIEY